MEFAATHDRILPIAPTAGGDGSAIVVWRTWILAPDDRAGASPGPLLTGVFGFPWRTADLDAKCTIQDLDHGSVASPKRRIDRHHPAVPEPHCTCGIYASTDLARDVVHGLIPRGRPVATGLVELSGRLLRDGTVVRAQHARIVGPLTLGGGRPPLIAAAVQRFGFPLRPERLVTERAGYRVVWGPSPVGVPIGTFLAEARRRLAQRYRVEVF